MAVSPSTDQPGRSGPQAIVVKAFDDGSKGRPFGHCLVAGINRAPLKVTRSDAFGMFERVVFREAICKPILCSTHLI